MAKKIDDTNALPEKIDAPWVKRFFKAKFEIPIRVENALEINDPKGRWVGIRIVSDRSLGPHAPLRYEHHFPIELCQRCMSIVYKSHETLSKQTTGGNIERHSIAMRGWEFRELLQSLLANPIAQETQLVTT